VVCVARRYTHVTAVTRWTGICKKKSTFFRLGLDNFRFVAFDLVSLTFCLAP
jgi:hypothetical protein